MGLSELVKSIASCSSQPWRAPRPTMSNGRGERATLSAGTNGRFNSLNDDQMATG
jgi:hypothetical protein